MEVHDEEGLIRFLQAFLLQTERQLQCVITPISLCLAISGPRPWSAVDVGLMAVAHQVTNCDHCA